MVEKFNEIIKDSARGSLILMIGQIFSTVISALTLLIIARLLGPEKYGIVYIVLVPINLAILIQDLGIDQAIIRYTAQWRSQKRPGDIIRLIKVGLAFRIVTSGALSLALWVGADVVASIYLKRPELTGLVKVVSLNVLGESLINLGQSALIGHERMGHQSLALVLRNLIRGIISVTLVLFGFGSLGPLLASTVTSYLIAAVVLVFLSFTLREKQGQATITYLEALKMLLSFGFPLYISVLLSGGLNQVQNLLMTQYIPNDLIGNYFAATNFGTLISFFTAPFATVLLPLFSKLSGDNFELAITFQKSVKYITLITLPVTLCLMAISEPVTTVLYGGGYALTSSYLKGYLIIYLFYGLGYLSVGGLAMSVGETRLALICNILYVLLGIPMSLFLIPVYGIWGLITTLILAPKVGLITYLWWIKKKLGFTVDWSSSLRLYIAGLVSILFTLLILRVTNVTGWAAVFIGGIACFLSYGLVVPAVGGLTRNDLSDLAAISDLAGPFNTPIRVILSIMERISRYTILREG